MMFSDVKWIFFDVGSTIIDEEKAYDHRLSDMIEATDLTFDEVNAKRISFAKDGFDGNSKIISYFGLTKTPWHTEDEFLFDETESLLKHLKTNCYRLGIIANQLSGLRCRLEKFGILRYFDVIVSSSDVGISKPDRKIFKEAIFLAKTSADKSVMIGDRLDNDIIPAKQCGMKTIWIRQGLSAYTPKSAAGSFADKIVDSLEEIKYIFP